MRLLLTSLAAALLVFVLSGFGVRAQEDDKSLLTRTLQDLLSGAGRSVSIDGFAGALTAQASFERMTVSDD
ncbi:MAG: hypothetical protein AAF307_01560, partial [Pseudomonadota bacterium]